MTKPKPPEPITAADAAKAYAEIKRRKRERALDFYRAYPRQAEFHALGATKHERALIAGNRTGKALANETPVLTPRGWVSIASLRIGDDVIGGDGNPCQVTGVFPQGQREVVRVVFDDNASLVCDKDHLWKWRKHKGGWQIGRTDNLSQYLGKPTHRPRIPVATPYIERRVVDVDPYVLGLLLGDGCFRTSQIMYSSADRELVDAIALHFPISKRGHGKQGGASYDWNIGGGLVTKIKNLGLHGLGSWEKHVPRDYLLNGIAQRLAVLQGLMDTDGYCEKGGTAVFYTTSLQLAYDVQGLVRSLGGKAKIFNKQTHFYQKTIKTAGRPSFVVRANLAVCPFRLSRKVKRWKSYGRTLDRIMYAIEPAGVEECTCISVNSNDGTFITKDFIVTHNSYAAAAEVAMHLTGLYPKWWKGRVFDHPVRMWSAGMTGLAVRDVNQRALFGTPSVVEDRGTGMVPKSCVDWNKGVSLAHGYAGLYDTVQVKHAKGGISTVRFMTYEQGREKWQGETLDLIHCDEEPPLDLYSEGMTRLVTTGGIMLCTFTPLMGRTAVVSRYLSEPSPDRAVVSMTIDDAEHIPAEDRARIIASYPSYERAARARGEPMMGVGRVFEIDEDVIKEPAVNPLPPHWRKLWAIDIGTKHPFAAVLLAYDADADVIHVVHAFKMKESRPIDHASAMKPWGRDIPVAWPHDGHIRERGSVEPVMRLYKQAGLKILPSHAAFPDGSISTEAGIKTMDDRMKSGRFKVASHLGDWFEEFRHYHREPKSDGSSEIVKQNDDLMSATRIGCMTIRSARAVDAGFLASQGGVTQMCKDVDFNPFQSFGDAA